MLSEDEISKNKIREPLNYCFNTNKKNAKVQGENDPILPRWFWTPVLKLFAVILMREIKLIKGSVAVRQMSDEDDVNIPTDS